jgi:hypothetical protein
MPGFLFFIAPKIVISSKNRHCEERSNPTTIGGQLLIIINLATALRLLRASQ